MQKDGQQLFYFLLLIYWIVHFFNSSAIFLSLLSLGTLFCPPSFPMDFM